MAGRKRSLPPLSEAFAADLATYLDARRAGGMVEATARSSRNILGNFLRFLEGRGVAEVAEVSSGDVVAYLAEVRGRHLERALSSSPEEYVLAYAYVVRRFFAWAAKAGRVLVDPATDVPLPREPVRPPRDALTREEAARLLAAPNTRTPAGIRDRAIMEVMYSSGLRRGEVAALDLGDVALVERRVFVRSGKGRKDRVVPVGARAAEWLGRYLTESRVVFERDSSLLAFFLTERGERVKTTTLADLFARHREAAGLTRIVTPHTLRHTCATHLMQGGADVRYIQALLGHESIETTQVYTHVAPLDLEEAHRAHHPRGAGHGLAKGVGNG